MNTMVDVTKPLNLAGARQKVAVAVWAVIFGLSLISFAISVVGWNIWDRVPAADLPAYFKDMTQEDIATMTAWKDGLASLGFSLASYAYLFSAFRLVGSLALFAVSFFIARRYSWHLLAILFAILLAVLGASGVWTTPLFWMAPALAPWLTAPTMILNVLLWFGLIMLYAFPDGRFTPRWTPILVILLIPIVISLIFDLPIFLNPETWPEPLPLLPNLVFIGAALFSVVYRYTHTRDQAKKNALRGVTLGVSLLMALYFILFFLTDGYAAVTDASLFTTQRANLTYTVISEALWYGLELAFALLVYRSIFRDRLFERWI